MLYRDAALQLQALSLSDQIVGQRFLEFDGTVVGGVEVVDRTSSRYGTKPSLCPQGRTKMRAADIKDSNVLISHCRPRTVGGLLAASRQIRKIRAAAVRTL